MEAGEPEPSKGFDSLKNLKKEITEVKKQQYAKFLADDQAA